MHTDSQLVRGLRILELLSQGDMNAADVAGALGVNRSTGWRLLETLRSLGYISRDRETACYSLNAQRLHALVQHRLEHSSWYKPVALKLEAIRNESSEATILAVPGNGVMVYVDFFPSLKTITIREELGTVRPMHSSAIGKAYLSGLSDEELEAQLKELLYEKGTTRSPKGPAELRRLVLEARTRGYALDLAETMEDAACVAVPIFIKGRVVGAVGISGPFSRLTEERLSQLGQLTRREMELAGFGRPPSSSLDSGSMS